MCDNETAMNTQETPSKYSNSVVQQTVGLVLLCLFLSNSFANIEGSTYTDMGLLIPALEIIGGLAFLVLSAVTARKLTVVRNINKGLMVANAIIAILLLGGTGLLFFFGFVFALAMGSETVLGSDVFGSALVYVLVYAALLGTVLAAQMTHMRRLER